MKPPTTRIISAHELVGEKRSLEDLFESINKNLLNAKAAGCNNAVLQIPPPYLECLKKIFTDMRYDILKVSDGLIHISWAHLLKPSV